MIPRMLIERHKKYKIYVYLSFFLVVFLLFILPKKVMADSGSCSFNQFCPSICEFRKSWWNKWGDCRISSNKICQLGCACKQTKVGKTYHCVKDWYGFDYEDDEDDNYPLEQKIKAYYDFQNYQTRVKTNVTLYKKDGSGTVHTSFVHTNRDENDISGCLPDFSEQKINQLQMIFTDSHGNGKFTTATAYFRRPNGSQTALDITYGDYKDLKTCTFFYIYVDYNSSVQTPQYAVTWTDYSPPRRYDAFCKSCRRPGCPNDCCDGSCHERFDCLSKKINIYLQAPQDYKFRQFRQEFSAGGQGTVVYERIKIQYETEPVESPPDVTTNGPSDCDSQGTFTVNAVDNDSGQTVNNVDLKINYDGDEYVYGFDIANQAFSEPDNSPFNVTDYTMPSSVSNDVTVELMVDNLRELAAADVKEYTISYQGCALDSSGDSACNNWKNFRQELYEPDITMSTQQNFTNPDGEVELVYTVNNAKPSECQWGAEAEDVENNTIINNSWTNINYYHYDSGSGDEEGSLSPAMGDGSCTGSTTFTPAPEDVYTFYIKASGGLCADDEIVSNELEVYDPVPWVMTGWGDVFARDGYSYYLTDGGDTYNLMMWALNYNVNIPIENDNSAYFSTYILSKYSQDSLFPNTNLSGDGKSFKNYLLNNYDDQNQYNLGTDAEGQPLIFNYLSELADKNNCGSECEVYSDDKSVSSLACSGAKVFFIDGNLTFNTSLNAGASDACVFVVSGDVTVAPSVSNIDGFVLTDGEFITEREADNINDEILLINGGVITSTADFDRFLENNSENPAEIINYEGKYLDMLNSILGEDYPNKIKEYNFASAED